MADDTKQATRDQLDLETIAGSDRMLRLPTVDGWRVFPTPGDLSVPAMAKLLIVERRIDESDNDTVEAAFQAAVDEIMRVVRLRTPDAPDINMDEFGVNRIAATLAWLSGAPTVGDAFQLALTSGIDPAAVEKAVATAHAQSEEPPPTPLVEEPDPLASTDASSTRSSGSDEQTGGDQSGGESAASERSGSTSLTATNA